MNSLTVPPAAVRDDTSVEMLRVWIAERGLHCSLKVGVYSGDSPISEAKAWGTILADTIQHLADALHAEGVGERSALVDEIRANLESELDAPTSERQGGFVHMN